MIKKILKLFFAFKWRFYRLFLKIQFKKIGENTFIKPYIEYYHPQYIEIGDNCYILKNVVLMPVPIYSEKPVFKICNRVRINYDVQISSVRSVILEDGSVIAANTFITDSTHDYTKIDRWAFDAPPVHIGDVVIGEGTWVGRNCIISGCKLGKHCIIGANSLVNKDIPDYCVAVGNPARIVKRYNFETKQWERTNPDGSFKNNLTIN